VVVAALELVDGMDNMTANTARMRDNTRSKVVDEIVRW
jgi:hypothetical protein